MHLLWAMAKLQGPIIRYQWALHCPIFSFELTRQHFDKLTQVWPTHQHCTKTFTDSYPVWPTIITVTMNRHKPTVNQDLRAPSFSRIYPLVQTFNLPIQLFQDSYTTSPRSSNSSSRFSQFFQKVIQVFQNVIDLDVATPPKGIP
jgi:hypothetical protein